MSEQCVFSVFADMCAMIEQWVAEDLKGVADLESRSQEVGDSIRTMLRSIGADLASKGALEDLWGGLSALPACCRAKLGGDLGPGLTFAANVAEDAGESFAKDAEDTKKEVEGAELRVASAAMRAMAGKLRGVLDDLGYSEGPTH